MSKKKMSINLLGVKLKLGREAKGISQEEVAIKLAEFGVTVRDIDEWENGYAIPDETKITELANLYNINANELIQIKNDTENSKAHNDAFHRQKFVGRTFWEVFGDLIIKLIKIAILATIIFVIIKTDAINKFIQLWKGDETQDEEYYVDDEYLRMLNSNRRSGKDYLKENQ